MVQRREGNRGRVLLPRQGWRGLEDLKLMKLMYLAEREALKRRNCSITGDRFYSMKNGPVLSSTLDRMTPRDQVDVAGVWREHIELPIKWDIRLLKPYKVDKTLSTGEMSIVEDVWSLFGEMNKWQLVNLTHDFPEWHNPGGTSTPISLAEIFAGMGFDAERTESRLSEERSDDAMEALIREASVA